MSDIQTIMNRIMLPDISSEPLPELAIGDSGFDLAATDWPTTPIALPMPQGQTPVSSPVDPLASWLEQTLGVSAQFAGTETALPPGVGEAAAPTLPQQIATGDALPPEVLGSRVQPSADAEPAPTPVDMPVTPEILIEPSQIAAAVPVAQDIPSTQIPTAPAVQPTKTPLDQAEAIQQSPSTVNAEFIASTPLIATQAAVGSAAALQTPPQPAPASLSLGMSGMRDIPAPPPLAQAAPAQTDMQQPTPVPVTTRENTTEIAPIPDDAGRLRVAMPDPAARADLPLGMTRTRDIATAPPMAHAAPAHTDPRPVMQQVTSALVSTREDATEIALSPEELGRIRLVMSGPDRSHVTIWAERPETLDLVRRNADLLTQHLQEAGIETSDMEFRQDDGGLWQDHPAGSRTGPGDEDGGGPVTTLVQLASTPVSDRRIDIRL